MRTYLKNTEIQAGMEMSRKEIMDQGRKMVNKMATCESSQGVQ